MRPRSSGVVMVALFLALASVILVATAGALAFPGSQFEKLWTLYPERRDLLVPYKLVLIPAFMVLAVVCATACTGCIRRRKWGWQLAVLIFALSALGSAVQMLFGQVSEGGFGLAVTGMILFFLTQPDVQRNFFDEA